MNNIHRKVVIVCFIECSDKKCILKGFYRNTKVKKKHKLKQKESKNRVFAFTGLYQNIGIENIESLNRDAACTVSFYHFIWMNVKG